MRTIFAILFVIPTALVASDFDVDNFEKYGTITCTFDFGQYLDPKEDKTDTQSTPLVWHFFDLRGKEPNFRSGGDEGPVFVNFHKSGGGFSIVIFQLSGAHLFSVWQDGTAFWSKHNKIGMSKATQQLRGTCEDRLQWVLKTYKKSLSK